MGLSVAAISRYFTVFNSFTMTLPGIAGIILTMGMAVDANILIFERMREEVNKGRSIRDAITLGFTEAYRTIVDSNLTTMVAGFVLFYFGQKRRTGLAFGTPFESLSPLADYERTCMG